MRAFFIAVLTMMPFLMFAQGGLSINGNSSYDSPETYKKRYLEQYVGFTIPEYASLDLYDTVSNWIGTPYKFAGNCEKGIDCSGFVHILISRVYGFNPGARNSADLYELTDKIAISEIEEGDLVFFRIHRRRISHVGIYLGQNKFVHSSTSKGVIISDLNEPYYKKYFAGPGRFKKNVPEQKSN